MAARGPNLPAHLRALAMRYPETTEGTSCTKAAFKVRTKSFLFLEEKEDSWNLMLKLDESLDEAELLAEKQPDNYSVGKHGWTTLRFPSGKGPPVKLLDRWVDESFRLLAPRKLVAVLDECGLA